MRLALIMSNLIEINNISFKHDNKVIFDNLAINIRRGKITAILGPSGTGKTTLLRLIGAQLKPHRGTIHFNDKNMQTLSQKELYHVRSSMGLLFQSGALFTNLSTFENVAFPLREHTTLPESLIHD